MKDKLLKLLNEPKFAFSRSIRREDFLEEFVKREGIHSDKACNRLVGVHITAIRQAVSNALLEKGYRSVSGRTSKNPLFERSDDA